MYIHVWFWLLYTLYMFIILGALKWILFEMKKKIFYSGFRQFWWGDWRERRNQECLHSLPLRKEEHHQSHQRHEENEVQSYTHCGGHTEGIQRDWGRNTGVILSLPYFSWTISIYKQRVPGTCIKCNAD